MWIGQVLLLSVFAASGMAQVVHAPDGGSREMLTSISVPEKPGAPFRATVSTTWKRRLEDGREITVYNRRTIARDSTGRVFQERRYLAPDGNSRPTPLTQLEYYDPERSEIIVCEPRILRCTVRPGRMTAGDANPLAAIVATRDGYRVTRESLGEKTVQDLQVLGSREISSGPQLGNDEPTVKEFWYSPRLGMNVIVRRFEPRGGAQDFMLEEVSQAEPDASLFTPPQGYQVVQLPPLPDAQIRHEANAGTP